MKSAGVLISNKGLVPVANPTTVRADLQQRLVEMLHFRG